MKKLSNLLARLEATPTSDSSILSEPHALNIRGGRVLPTKNGTCKDGNNETCTNSTCDGSTNGLCSNDACFA